MYNRFQLASRYLRYYITASNGKGHGIHSPFLFEFITKVMNDGTVHPSYTAVEELRRNLAANQTMINVEDLGAGSATTKSNRRSISSIARHAAKPKKFGQLLYRMVNYYQPSVILELGTSLGITTAYLASGNSSGRVITLEGAGEVLELARDNFKMLRLENIETKPGNFDDSLPGIISEQPAIDFCFIDGNHRLQPTIKYFEMILPKTHNFSVIILDDIHWSREMERAWDHCRNHADITMSIDLFFIGILIARKEIKEQQHFSIRF